MRKAILIQTLVLSVLNISCDKDKNEVNEPPSAVTIEVAAEDLGNSINFTWKAATDPNGDKIVYDFYANKQTAGAGLTKLGYNWLFSEHTDIKYPISFKVIAKDGKGGTSESNTIERQDPLVGIWQLSATFEDDVPYQLDDCHKKTTLTLMENMTFAYISHGSLSGDPNECVPDSDESYTGKWSIPSANKLMVTYDDDGETAVVQYTVKEKELALSYRDSIDDSTVAIRDIYIRQ